MKNRTARAKVNPAFYLILAVSVLFVLVPVFWMLSTALKPETDLFSTPPRLWPTTPDLSAFVRVFTDYPFVDYFRNSLVVVSASTLISLAFSALSGYGLSRFNFRGKGSFLTFLLISQMFPSIMLLIPYYKIMQTFGLVNTQAALILTYVSFTIPFCSWMMYGYFKSIPRELDEAAAIDGASRFGTFFRIVLPLTVPGLVATAIYSFITGWNEYIFALILTSSEDMKTVPVGIGQLIGQYKIQWNDLMAASLYAVIPLMIFFIFLQRYLISGLTAGGVKN
ncbi:carbohydrate ABC transporter permease [Glaciibacter sp. 2TAF33]|uniref:carbohydrate ABC transporter permease n=1 Tax=Glaciibacter sp. 2TAF33 TaxID=3233015 RepID=UPI003F92C1EC